jgi:hypothetical protein
MLDDLVDRPRRQQRPALALMAGLRALHASRSVLAVLGRSARRIVAGWLRRVARGPPDPALEHSDPLVLRSDTLLQAPDLLVHPQQHRDHHRITALVSARASMS